MADNNNISGNNRSNLLSLINTNQDHHHDAKMMVMKEQLQHHSSSSTIHGAAEQLILPIANVGRMMKEGLPRGAKVSKEAKETMQECATEFISFVTAEASGRCRRDRRKTLNGDDVLWALQALGFDDYTAPLGRYLHRYHQLADADGPHVRERAANAAVDGINGGSEEY